LCVVCALGRPCATEAKDTPLQEKLEHMATKIGYFGFVFAFLTFIAMIVSWFADNSRLDGYRCVARGVGREEGRVRWCPGVSVRLQRWHRG
jgi:hypothetical protein